MRHTHLVFLAYIISVKVVRAQDYEVADVKCYYSHENAVAISTGEINKLQLVARLKRPRHFRGHPLFADDLKVNPQSDPYCSIVPEAGDVSLRIYRMTITDLSRCGASHHTSGYVHVRIWFPLLPSAMTSQDQEVILACKPPESTILTAKVTELKSTAPRQARVSGVVEQSSSKLEYQVTVYRYGEEGQQLAERPLQSAGRITKSGPYLIPVDDAIPIGTPLQLRMAISSPSAWRYAKLVEVTVSTDPKDPHAEGHVRLLHLGCLTSEMKSLMRGQARRLPAKPSEVWMDFEAFLLAPSNYSDKSKNARREGQQWIHTTVLACLEEAECQPGLCNDPTDSVGYGKRKRSTNENETSNDVQFDNRIAIRILVPEGNNEVKGEKNCGIWVVPVGVLVSTTAASLLLFFIACRMNSQKKKELAEIRLPPN